MVIFSLVCAGISVLLSIFLLFETHSFLFLFFGLLFAAFFVLIANILSNQQSIMEWVERQELQTDIEKRKLGKKLSCSHCNKKFEVNRSSCPHCGVKAS